MTVNPLVAGEQTSTSWHSGMGFVDSLSASAEAAGSGDWVEAGLNGMAGGLETLGAIADPFGALMSAGIGFLIEHFGPLKSMLDGLAGDPDQIHAFASTWHNVSDRVHETAGDYRGAVARLEGDWHGPAMSAYAGFAQMHATILDAMGTMTTGVAGAVEIGGILVGAVRNMVRDFISDVVGFAISKALEVLTVALAPKAIAEIVGKVSEWAARASAFVKQLISSMGKLGDLLTEIGNGARSAHVKVTEIAERVSYLQDSFSVAPNGSIKVNPAWIKSHAAVETGKSGTANDNYDD